MDRTQRLSVRLNSEEYKLVRKIAKKLERSRSDAIRLIIKKLAAELKIKN